MALLRRREQRLCTSKAVMQRFDNICVAKQSGECLFSQSKYASLSSWLEKCPPLFTFRLPGRDIRRKKPANIASGRARASGSEALACYAGRQSSCTALLLRRYVCAVELSSLTHRNTHASPRSRTPPNTTTQTQRRAGSDGRGHGNLREERQGTEYVGTVTGDGAITS